MSATSKIWGRDALQYALAHGTPLRRPAEGGGGDASAVSTDEAARLVAKGEPVFVEVPDDEIPTWDDETESWFRE